MYRNKDIPNELMELVKSRYMVQEERHGVLQAEAHKLLQVARGGGIGEQGK